MKKLLIALLFSLPLFAVVPAKPLNFDPPTPLVLSKQNRSLEKELQRQDLSDLALWFKPFNYNKLLLPLIAITLGLILYAYLKNRPPKRPKLKKPTLKEELDTLKKRSLIQKGEYELYITEISRIIRQSLFKQPLSLTYQETLKQLQLQGVSTPYIELAGTFFNLCELSHYAHLPLNEQICKEVERLAYKLQDKPK